MDHPKLSLGPIWIWGTLSSSAWLKQPLLFESLCGFLENRTLVSSSDLCKDTCTCDVSWSNMHNIAYAVRNGKWYPSVKTHDLANKLSRYTHVKFHLFTLIPFYMCIRSTPTQYSIEYYLGEGMHTSAHFLLKKSFHSTCTCVWGRAEPNLSSILLEVRYTCTMYRKSVLTFSQSRAIVGNYSLTAIPDKRSCTYVYYKGQASRGITMGEGV